MRSSAAARLVLSISLLPLATACGSLARFDTVGATPASRRPLSYNARSVIAPDEIREARARTAYDLVQSLRPEYLLGGVEDPAAPISPARGMPRVYVDGLNLAGGVAGLAAIPVERVAEIRYLNANAPNNWYGVYGNRTAVILVETRPGSDG